MGTIVDKFNYSFEAKDLIKDSINNLGGSITSETELKEYAQELDNIYDNLPKTTGEDTNLSLTTLKGKMNTTLKGDTQQTQYSGYNLLNLTLDNIKGRNTSGTWNNNVYTISGLTITINEDMSIKANGTSTEQVTLILENKIMPYATGTYYLSGATNGSTTLYDVRIFNYDGSSGVAQCFTGTKQVAIVNNSQGYNVAVVIRSGVTCNNTMFYPMLSTTNTSNYEPYVGGTASPNPTYPQNIEVVTGTQEVKVENKNLLKLQTLTEQTNNGVTFTPHYENGLLQYINVNGTADGTATYNLQGGNVDSASTFPCSIKQGGYTLSGYLSSINNYKAIYLRYTYDNSTFTTISATTKTSVTFTQDCKIASYIRIQSGYTATNEKVYPQLEKGSTATTYVEHQEQTQTISLGNIELCKIGNYQDYLYKSNDKWYKKEYIGKVVLNGSENWVTRSGGTSYAYAVTNFLPQNASNGLCNYWKFIVGGAGGSQANECMASANTTTALNIFTNNTSLNSVANLKTWLGTNTPIVYFNREVANDIEITNSTLIEQLDNLEKLKSYNGVTNINCSGNLSAILGVSALKGE